jgi:hypothetical protein
VTSWFDDASHECQMTERLVGTSDQVSRGAHLSTIFLNAKVIELKETEWA